MTDTPVVVNPDQTTAQLGLMIRYVLTSIGGYLVGKGWIEGDVLEVAINIAVVVGPIAYASYISHKKKQDLLKVAVAAPDEVAVIKGVEPA